MTYEINSVQIAVNVYNRKVRRESWTIAAAE